MPPTATRTLITEWQRLGIRRSTKQTKTPDNSRTREERRLDDAENPVKTEADDRAMFGAEQAGLTPHAHICDNMRTSATARHSNQLYPHDLMFPITSIETWKACRFPGAHRESGNEGCHRH